VNTDREPHRWRTLALYDVHRARLWQGVICTAVILALIAVAALTA
jgi:hypothetical protein